MTRAATLGDLLDEATVDLAAIGSCLDWADAGTERAVRLAAETLEDEAKRLRVKRCSGRSA